MNTTSSLGGKWQEQMFGGYHCANKSIWHKIEKNTFVENHCLKLFYSLPTTQIFHPPLYNPLHFEVYRCKLKCEK
jgi:hypothetical protein